MRDPELESTGLRDCADVVAKMVKKNWPDRKLGFAVLVFDFGDGGHVAYMSNAQRDDMVKALRELAASLATRLAPLETTRE